MTRITFFRRSGMFALLAGMLLLFVCTMGNVAHAQQMPPCDTIWVDTDVPGTTVSLTWTPMGPMPTSVSPLPGANPYLVTPPGTLTAFSITLPCGATIGPFSGPFTFTTPGMCIPDPCNPGKCLYVRGWTTTPTGCEYEIHLFQGNENLCPTCK